MVSQRRPSFPPAVGLLQIPVEMQRSIVEAVESIEDLVSLALVCKDLTDLALVAVWSTLPGFLPLVKLLPADIIDDPTSQRSFNAKFGDGPFDKDEVLGSLFPVTITRALTQSDLSRLLVYAPLVRDITFSEGQDRVSLSVVQALGSLKGTLFPQLRKLEWKANSPEGVAAILPFLQPTVHNLLFSLLRDDARPNPQRFYNAALDLVASLPTRTPDLVELMLAGIPHDENTPVAPLHLKKLKSMYGDSFGAHLLPSLVGCPNIGSIHLVADDSPTEMQLLDTVPTLHSLTIFGAPDATCNILNSLPHIRPQFLHIASTISQALPGRVLPTVREHFADSITNFGFHSILPCRFPFPISVEELSPLLDCRLLTDLQIDLNTKLLNFNRDVLTNMANSWPHLVNFKLIDSAWYGDSDFDHVQLTLPDLYPLVTRCPDLRQISLAVRLTGLEPCHPLEFGLPTDSNIEEVHFGHSMFTGQPLLVSKILATLFPCVPWDGLSGYPCEGWEAVAAVYPLRRIQEKRRRASQDCSPMSVSSE